MNKALIFLALIFGGGMADIQSKQRVREYKKDAIALEACIPLTQKSFFFIRHGQTDWNKEHKLQGQIDIPLNQTGREQATALQKVVCTLSISHVYSSPLSRARETMELACKHITAPQAILEGLKERHFGEWEGTPWDDFKNLNHLEFVPVHGESYSQFHNRLVSDVNAVLNEADGTVLLVGHGGVFRAFCRATQTSTEKVPNCQLFYFIAPKVQGGQWTLHTF